MLSGARSQSLPVLWGCRGTRGCPDDAPFRTFQIPFRVHVVTCDKLRCPNVPPERLSRGARTCRRTVRSRREPGAAETRGRGVPARPALSPGSPTRWPCAWRLGLPGSQSRPGQKWTTGCEWCVGFVLGTRGGGAKLQKGTPPTGDSAGWRLRLLPLPVQRPPARTGVGLALRVFPAALPHLSDSGLPGVVRPHLSLPPARFRPPRLAFH